MTKYQWEIALLAGRTYSIRNSGTQRYLGMKLGANIESDYELYEVDHVF